ncbi:Uncharacterised protein [uncultured archaeon]|nr:Uncharacterised protein [uncultured archaeon]
MCLTKLTLLVPKIQNGKRICILENGKILDADNIATLDSLEIFYNGQEKVTVNSEKEHLNSNAILLGDITNSELKSYHAYFCKV